MKYERPLLNDFEQIVVLQNENLISRLSSSEKADGYLSEAFSVEQLKSMDEDICVFVCKDKERVCGYICVNSVEYNKNIPLVASMLDCFPDITYQGKPLSTYNIAISGPVCIDKAYRGQGLFFNLYNKLSEFLLNERPELELYVVLISSQNLRSVNAHKKLGMEDVGAFSFDKNDFLIMAVPINQFKGDSNKITAPKG
ncbi:N-acetyltransferase [Legionella qingyii]|uniref:N-acetyltransferase n=1 Tax=Legionella qingyii TaxID=2184757 RepID=A0A317U2E0_9GAMM|nr:GNAT family N-acetyltransferase [Legionella qingyii]PWY55408.1 N-acetyltransferase [Legionella qingyii]RUR21190.1 GNAT family N-acetyltransferase [Legionella qingyii]